MLNKIKLVNLTLLRKSIYFISTQSRYFSAKTATKKPRETSKNPKVFNDILQHCNLDIIKHFPEKLLRKKHKIPHCLYVADQEAAKIIAHHVTNDLAKDMTVTEINPGPGVLTNELIKKDISKIILFEVENAFLPNLEELHTVYPDRIKVKSGDFLNMWKLHFRDKIDNGTRLNDLLNDIPKKGYTDDVNIRLVGGIGHYDFFMHLMNSLTFQTSLISYGRCEMYLVLPPPLYTHFTCNNEAGYLMYRATSILFQVMFEYKFLARLHRKQFLPWQFDYNLSKQNKLTKVKSINTEYLYLVKIVPRRNLYELCPAEDMPAFWYFVKQNCISRKNCVIPNLERWIPGCGPRLIINLNKTESVHQLYEHENSDNLPPLTKPCTTMSNRDYFPFMNIYTQFGDLTPSQMLTLFCQFRSWPEYKDSLFLASLESSMLKMESSSEEHIDCVDIIEEDDLSNENNPDPIDNMGMKKSS